jgi:hypothetical protein
LDPTAPEAWLLLIGLFFYTFVVCDLAGTRLVTVGMITNAITFSSWFLFRSWIAGSWAGITDHLVSFLTVVVFGIVAGACTGSYSERLIEASENPDEKPLITSHQEPALLWLQQPTPASDTNSNIAVW